MLAVASGGVGVPPRTRNILAEWRDCDVSKSKCPSCQNALQGEILIKVRNPRVAYRHALARRFPAEIPSIGATCRKNSLSGAQMLKPRSNHDVLNLRDGTSAAFENERHTPPPRPKACDIVKFETG